MNFPQAVITSREGVVVRNLFNSGKGVLGQMQTLKNQQQKKHERKVNYLKIFLIESTIYNLQSINASTILDKIFEIK